MTPPTIAPIVPPLRPEDEAGAGVAPPLEGVWAPPATAVLPDVGAPALRVMLGMTWVFESETAVDEECELEEEEEEEEREEAVVDVEGVDKELTEEPLTPMARVMEGLTVETCCELCTGKLPGPHAGAFPPTAMKHCSPGRQQ